MSDQSRLEIAYDGPPLSDNSMNVLGLAPAMMAIGTLDTEANATVNGDQSTISVNVLAMPAGSFEINYDVIHQASQVLLQTAPY